VLLLANKWDTVPPAKRDATTFRTTIATLRPGFADLPILCVSARTGEGLGDLFPRLAPIERAYRATLPTPALNRALRAAVAAHAPPSSRGRVPSLLYAAQTATAPPAVTVFASNPAAVPEDYARYLATRLRERFRLVGVPLRVVFRARPGVRRTRRR
jgi:GTP-binding protein